MLDDFLKDKKKIGIIVVLAIVIIAAGGLYCAYGFKELNKNDTETIFVDEGNSEQDEDDIEESCLEGKKKEPSDNKNKLKEKNITVEIKGEVKKPDVYILKENSIVKDLIEQAGGLTENADITNINRAKQLQNHELINIANKNNISESSSEATNIIKNNQFLNDESMININSATLDELKKLNGIGESKAKSIIEYREKNGGFKTIEDIKNVEGIGEKMFERIKDTITI